MVESFTVVVGRVMSSDFGPSVGTKEEEGVVEESVNLLVF